MRYLLLPLLFSAAASAQEIGTEAWYAVPDARGVQVVHIECGSNYIDPREIVVAPGVPVELAVRSAQGQAQQFVSGLVPDVALGKLPQRVRFTPVAQGRHVMECKDGPGGPGAHAGPNASDNLGSEGNSRRRGVVHVGHPHGRP